MTQRRKDPDRTADVRGEPEVDSPELSPEAGRHRSYVGTADAYDITGAMQFGLMIALGLREYHSLLDIGCGSLSAGRLLIPYLLAGNYYGLEPEAWLVEDGIRFELSEELRRLKRPHFRHVGDFSLSGFNLQFDFMLAQSVFTHVSQAQLDRALEEAKLALKPEGLWAASFYAHGDDVYSGDGWTYPRFASYPFKFVVARAHEHQLAAFPLIWTNTYGHYWMIFAHQSQHDRFSWLLNLAAEQRMLRVLELTRQLGNLRLEHEQLKEQLRKVDSARVSPPDDDHSRK